MADVHAGDLLSVARDELLSALVRAQRIVRLASPFLSEDVARAIAAQARAGRATDRRLVCAVTERSVAAGMLSIRGLGALLDLGWEVRSIPNLHAKVVLVDRSWGLVGSGNLTGAGIGRPGAAGGNIELGVVLSARQRATAVKIFDTWWDHKSAEPVTHQALEPFLELERLASSRGSGLRIGRAIRLPASRVIARRRLGPETGLWIKAMYHRDPSRGDWWMTRTWIHDRHLPRADGGITRRPGYQIGDRIVLYVVEPQRCPAIFVVTGLPEDRRELVRSVFPDDADRYGWVTPVDVLAAVPLDRAPPLTGLTKNPHGLQNGYVRLPDRDAYRRLERRLMR
jgi:hypothetical protein